MTIKSILYPQVDHSIPLSIIYEDNDIIVVDKQAGISVHPSRVEPSGTLVNALLGQYPELKKIGEDPLRPGIIHRLDKDTSGVLVVARNQEAFEWLKTQFQKGLVEKEYIALVDGKIAQPSGTLELALGRRGMKQVPPRASERKPLKKLRKALTEYRVLKRFLDSTLLLVKPRTGRMHQIRAHFAAIGHPIVGDKLYGPRKKKWKISRQFLHASRVSFSMPEHKRFSFESELPVELVEYLDSIQPQANKEEPEIHYE